MRKDNSQDRAVSYRTIVTTQLSLPPRNGPIQYHWSSGIQNATGSSSVKGDRLVIYRLRRNRGLNCLRQQVTNFFQYLCIRAYGTAKAVRERCNCDRMFGSTIIKYLRFSGDFGQVDKSVKHELESALRVHRLLLLKGNGYCLLSIAIFDDREMFSRLFTYIKSFQLRCLVQYSSW